MQILQEICTKNAKNAQIKSNIDSIIHINTRAKGKKQNKNAQYYQRIQIKIV